MIVFLVALMCGAILGAIIGIAIVRAGTREFWP